MRISLILFLFLFEKVVETALQRSHGDSIRVEMEALDRKLREELNSLSPWFLLTDLYEGMKVPVANELHLPATSSPPAGDAAEAIMRKQQPSPGLSSGDPTSGAEMAMRLADNSKKEELTRREVPANPLALIARIPTGCIYMISQSFSRGPIHLTLAVLLLVAAGFSLRPYTGRRLWLLLLVPPVAACFAAVLYFLCQGTAAVLGLSLLSIPSIPVAVGTVVAIGKIPFNMAVEKTIHRWLVNFISLFR